MQSPGRDIEKINKKEYKGLFIGSLPEEVKNQWILLNKLY
jgi:hypothetical protein